MTNSVPHKYIPYDPDYIPEPVRERVDIRQLVDGDVVEIWVNTPEGPALSRVGVMMYASPAGAISPSVIQAYAGTIQALPPMTDINMLLLLDHDGMQEAVVMSENNFIIRVMRYPFHVTHYTIHEVPMYIDRDFSEFPLARSMREPVWLG